METKICTQCQQTLPIERFGYSNKEKTRISSNCKCCKQRYITQHYKDNKECYTRRSIVRTQRVRQEARTFIMQYLTEHPCSKCGESDIRVLEFDHIVAKEKKGNISQMIANGLSLKTIKEEIEKCDVLCANCHRKKTTRQFNWFKKYCGVEKWPISQAS